MKLIQGKSIKIAAAIVLVAIFALCSPAALGDDGAVSNRAAAELFAVLPDGATGPEGLAVAPDGNVFVATFGFNAAGAVTGLGQLYVFTPEGKLLRKCACAEFVASSAGHRVSSPDRRAPRH